MRPHETPASTRVCRSLEGLEKAFYLMDRHPTHFTITAHVLGHTYVSEWQRALDMVCASSKLVWCSINEEQSGAPFFWERPIGLVPMDVLDFATTSWTDEVARQIANRFDTSEPPLLRAVLIHSEGRCVLILAAHHSICDGLSLSYLLADVIRTVSGLGTTRSSEIRSAIALVREQTHGFETRATSVVEPIVPSAPPKPYRQDDGRLPQVRAVRLSEETTHKLRYRARAESSSVHAALAAASSIAVSRIDPRYPFPRVITPVDLRSRLLGGTDHLSACVTGVVLASNSDRSVEFWERARSLGEGLTTCRSSEVVASMVLMGGDLLDEINSADDASNLFAAAFGGEILLSNLGILRIPRRFGALELDSIWGPSLLLGYVDEQMLGVATLNNRLHILYTSYSSHEELLPIIQMELEAAIA